MDAGIVAGDHDLCGIDCLGLGGIIRVRIQSEQIFRGRIAARADTDGLLVAASLPVRRPAASHQAGDKGNIVVCIVFTTDTEVILVAVVFHKGRARLRQSGIIVLAVAAARHLNALSRVPVNGRSVFIDDQGFTRRTGAHAAAKAFRAVIGDQRVHDRQVAFFLNENAAAAPVVIGIRYVIGNVYLVRFRPNHAGGAAGDTKTAALAQFGAVAGNGSAAHGKADTLVMVKEARVNAAACQAGIVAGDIAAGHVHNGIVRQSDAAAAVGVVDIVLAVFAVAFFTVVGHIAAGQGQRSVLKEDAAAVVRVSIEDLVARHRTAGDVQRSVLSEDTAAGTATVGRNDTAPDIHRSVVNVNTAAGRAVTAAAHNIAAIYVQRSAVHQDNMFAAGVLEYTAL